jgi:cytochrome c556
MLRPVARISLTFLFIIGLSIPAGAETTAKNAIKYRHAVMEAMAGHTAAFSMIAFGMVDQPEFLQSHANALADAGTQLKALFPDGSGDGDTEALPAIWDEPEKFSAAITKAEKATSDLRDAAASGDKKAIVGAFKALGKSCKGCHESFREEHDD